MDSIVYKIRNNDVEGLKILLEEKPGEINKPIDGSGPTPLLFACCEGADIRIIDILIDAGSQIGAKDPWGHTALHWAVFGDQPHAVEILLSRGSEVNPRDKAGQTPLHFACWLGHLHTVDLLLGHNGIDANVVNNDGDTPLHEAVRGRNYKVVCAMLKQDSVNLEIVNKKYRTPLLEAVSDGHLGIMQRLIARGTNVNVVEHGGNNCLHLALKRENNFHSEVEHMTMLDQFCKDLKLGSEERYSGVVVASYLAHHGANFYCKNKSGRTPLDLIKKAKLKKTLKTLFRPTPCRYCHENMATVRLQPCGDLVLCENCSSEMTFKRCPVCREYTLSKSEFGSQMFAEKEIQTEPEPVRCQMFAEKEIQTEEEPVRSQMFAEKEIQTEPEPVRSQMFAEKGIQTEPEPVRSQMFAEKEIQTEPEPVRSQMFAEKGIQREPEPVRSQMFAEKEIQTEPEPVRSLMFAEKGIQTEPEPVRSQIFAEKEIQTEPEPVRSLMFAEKEIQTEPEPVQIAQFVQEATKTSQQVESQKLEEKDLLIVAQNLGKNWRHVGIFLGIPSIKLEIIECDNPLNTVEQSYQMLRRWITSCDPDTNKFETLKESLKKAQCLTALLCLLNIK